MATYVVGDVQGCFLTFQKLLDVIKFNDTRDKIILLGDAINRGNNSLEMLRFVKNNSRSIEMVLGNHEIFAIAIYLGAYKNNKSHTLQSLLAADDRHELIDYLRKQPLIKKHNNSVFVHAGILPSQSIEDALKKGADLSAVLQSDDAKRFLTRFYEKTPTQDKPDLSAKKALRLALAYLCLLRMCESPSQMELSYNGTLEKAPKRLKPWFLLRNDESTNIYFGHWAALGLFHYNGYYCLDSGCVWGNKLSALRLSDKKIFQVDNCERP